MSRLDFERAIEKLTAAVNKNPSELEYQYYLGEAYRRYLLVRPEDKSKEDIFKKAEQAYKNAIKIDPEFSQARYGLGLLYSLLGRFDGAIAEFETMLKIDPTDKKANTEIARIYLRLDKPQQAKKYFQAASVGKDQTELLQKNFLLTSTQKIRLLDNKNINIESQIVWRVIDPILYAGTVGNFQTTNTRINDLYSATLMRTVSNKVYGEISKSLGVDIKNQIKNDLNDSILKRHFGIEILDLKILKVEAAK